MDINELKKTSLLQVFNLIITQGEKVEGGYEFSGIRACSDFDGYTCWMTYKDLTVTLMFHGTYDFDYQEKSTMQQFANKVSVLLADKNKHNSN